MVVVIIIFVVFGFMLLVLRGMLLMGMMLFYFFLGIVVGYVGVRMWSIIKGLFEGWSSIFWFMVCFFFGIVFVILILLNFIFWGSKSIGVIFMFLYFVFLFFWFCISVLFIFLGGFLGIRVEFIEYFVRIN